MSKRTGTDSPLATNIALFFTCAVGAVVLWLLYGNIHFEITSAESAMGDVPPLEGSIITLGFFVLLAGALACAVAALWFGFRTIVELRRHGR
ncbi:MAG: hypothetical protein ACXWNK_08640 [Vulcanimicrobiaceae bacterium]